MGCHSRYAAQPAWQRAAVSAYLRRAGTHGGGLPPAAAFNRSNRAYPDVAALGHSFLVYNQGSGQNGWYLMARFRSNALCCTATARVLISAECSAIL